MARKTTLRLVTNDNKFGISFRQSISFVVTLFCEKYIFYERRTKGMEDIQVLSILYKFTVLSNWAS